MGAEKEKLKELAEKVAAFVKDPGSLAISHEANEDACDELDKCSGHGTCTWKGEMRDKKIFCQCNDFWAGEKCEHSTGTRWCQEYKPTGWALNPPEWYQNSC